MEIINKGNKKFIKHNERYANFTKILLKTNLPIRFFKEQEGVYLIFLL